MISSFQLACATAGIATALGLAGILGGRRSPGAWCFLAGMLLLAVECLFSGLAIQSGQPGKIVFWQTLGLLVGGLASAFWLVFSLIYSRGNYREYLVRWRPVILLVFILPVGLLIALACGVGVINAFATKEGGWWVGLGVIAKVMNMSLLLSAVLILMNLENTFRSSVGTMQWRIKFLVLGLGVIFGTRIYTHTQTMLFSGHRLALVELETISLGIGCILIAAAYMRRGLSGIEVYPSRAVLRSSVVVVLAGGYLVIVGVLAQVVALVGGTDDFQTKAALVLVGIVFLAILLLSKRIQQEIQGFVTRHFKRPEHDFRRVWTIFTQNLPKARDQKSLCTIASRLISENLNVLSVSIWLVSDQRNTLTFAASTAPSAKDEDADAGVIADVLVDKKEPFDLETIPGTWADTLRSIAPSQFNNGGNRVCVPLHAGDRLLGVAVLADRVSGISYKTEELDLLKCIGDQVAAGLLGLRLNEDLMQARELEAFQTMSAFFVHDLKNAASRLSLMLQNLPDHYDDPEFRADALRGIGNTVNHINRIVSRLSALRNTLELRPVEFDLTEMIAKAMDGLEQNTDIEWVKNYGEIPLLVADREQLQNVMTNLLMNAKEAVAAGGRVIVTTEMREAHVMFSVSDNGCGMSRAFLKEQLFRPFQTTKKTGTGIGMFQSRMIVEAHKGRIEVESELGKGTTFRVVLPVRSRTE